MDANELDAYLAQARELAGIVGFTGTAGAPERAAGRWRISDTSHEAFGTLVPDAALQDEDSVVAREDVGLVLIDEGWTTMERVPEDE
eukprot:9996287-Alexandrium_andersonii.AAC.1